MGKKEQWIKPRHRLVRNLLYICLYPYAKVKYGLTVEKFRAQGKRAYLVLCNHQTPFDQFFVGMSFRGPLYYVATEDIFSMGWISSVIRALVAPIPIKKQTIDIRAIKTMMQVAREGGSICIAPEGNRTYSGKTEYMNPSIAALARRFGLPIALYRIQGGYGVEPRWSDVVRKGKVRAYVSEVIEPQDYATMTDEALFARIRDGLDVNEAFVDGRYLHKKRAEYLERVLYVCPFCGLAHFESHGARVKCLDCGREVVYGEDKTLQGDGFELPFRFVNDWYEYQKAFVADLDLTAYADRPLYEDAVLVQQVILNKRKQVLRKQAAVQLYGDRIEIDAGTERAWCLPFDQLRAVTVLGRNKLNLYHESGVYQLKGSKRFNAIKYVNIYHRYQNMQKGDENGKFLGL